MDKISRPFIEEFKQGKRTDYSTIQQSLTKAGMPLNKVEML